MFQNSNTLYLLKSPKFSLGYIWKCQIISTVSRKQMIFIRYVWCQIFTFSPSSLFQLDRKCLFGEFECTSVQELRHKFQKKNHFGTRYPFRRVKVTWSYILKINSRDQNCFGMYIICSICHHVTSFFTDQKSHLRAGIHAPEPAGARVSHQLAPTGARTKRYMDPSLRVLFVPSELLF